MFWYNTTRFDIGRVRWQMLLIIEKSKINVRLQRTC